MNSDSSISSLTRSKQALLAFLSLIIVAFGQPAWMPQLGLIAALFGYALFFRVLLCYPGKKQRFWIATCWFALVQVIQLSWVIAHPFLYIYPIYFVFVFLLGIQFGILSLFINPTALTRIPYSIAVASLWTIFEWLRLFFFSGYSWNPSGLALTGSLYPLQMASLWGVFGLTFWVMLVNLLALRSWVLRPSVKAKIAWAITASLPYFYGAIHLHTHESYMNDQQNPHFNALLVQTTFPVEEIVFEDRKKMLAFIIEEWAEILTTTKKHHSHPIDLIVLPEYVVPAGTYSFVFPYETVKKKFEEIFGHESLKSLPALNEPFAREISNSQSSAYFVNNAFWAQALANYFQAGVVIGLEDVEDTAEGKREFYSAALYFRPSDATTPIQVPPERYEKRVLVPLGEYIPFDFCMEMVANYGVSGSFTPGKSAKVFYTPKSPFGLSICYEETFGNLMRENRQKGAEILVNLTNDVWYPNSRLPQQHFSHARLRTVESGIPLIRSSNIGITGGFDSLGRLIGFVGEGQDRPEWVPEAILLPVPVYHYQTVYTHFGDAMIIGFSSLSLLFWLRPRSRKP